jgi:hypothetical protein
MYNLSETTIVASIILVAAAVVSPAMILRFVFVVMALGVDVAERKVNKQKQFLRSNTKRHDVTAQSASIFTFTKNETGSC